MDKCDNSAEGGAAVQKDGSSPDVAAKRTVDAWVERVKKSEDALPKADRRTRATERMMAERVIDTGICRSAADIPHPPSAG